MGLSAPQVETKPFPSLLTMIDVVSCVIGEAPNEVDESISYGFSMSSRCESWQIELQQFNRDHDNSYL